MTTIADDFGVWNNLGTVSPILNEWVKFPFQAIGGLNSIRLSFNYDLSLINDNNSYGLLRWTFNAGSNELIAKPQRVYVDKKTIILDLPIPQDLKDRGVYYRYFEIKKRPYYIPKWKIKDLNWQVKLEELWG
jgi:hypothetical protein